jgi:TolB-like protein
MSFFEELKRRNVFRVGIAYGVASWLLIQLSDILGPLFELPSSAQKFVLFLLLLGFIPALILAWAYEMTPEGLKKEKDVDRSQSIVPQTARKLDRAIIVILAAAVVFLLYRQLGFEPRESEQSIPEAPSAAILPDSDMKSVAVLPFVNMSSDPEQEYFSDGLSEELLNRLAKNDQLRVAARTSSFQFKGQNLDITDIGQQLNVANILEGSVRKAGDRLRITAQLIQVNDGFHLWSETYEREMDDIFAIQDEISLAISQALEAELGAVAESTRSPGPTDNLEAYNLYLQARYLLAQRGDQNMRQADELFSQAVALDPDFTLAWSGKAFNSALFWNYNPSVGIENNVAQTLDAARHALALDPDNAEAYTAIGRAMANDLQLEEARTHYERAYELDPKAVGVLNLYGDFLGFKLGDFDRAVRLKQQCISLDPLSGVHHSDIADLYLAMGDAEKALASARKGVQLAPGSLQRLDSLISALVINREFGETVSLIKQLQGTLPDSELARGRVKEWWAKYFFGSNELESLREIVADSIEIKMTDPGNPETLPWSSIAFYSLRWEPPAEVVRWLEKALAEKEVDLTFPLLFYLPERISDDPVWLEFWDRPELKQMFDIRRHNPYPVAGLWTPQPATAEPKS